MTVYQLDPLQDRRWPAFLERHADASIFHTAGWLQALHRIYGYEPVVYTTSRPGQELSNGIVFCRVDSRLTGRCLVSLPFADHCQPLVDTSEDLHHLLRAVERERIQERWKYVQLRPIYAEPEMMAPHTAYQPSQDFYLHQLDLRPDLPELFRRLHKSCVQRPIRRAERERLTYEEGASESLLARFYHLLVMTRRKHRLPPQPIVWFRHLINALGDGLNIRLACKDDIPVASIVTVSFKQSVVYKYGGSDPTFSPMGGMIALLWQAIEAAKQQGASQFDIGRSYCHQTGLVRFKDRWNPLRSRMTYYQCPIAKRRDGNEAWPMRAANRVFARLPEAMFIAVGKLLYKHMG